MKQKKKNRKRKHVAPTRKRRGHMDMKFNEPRAFTLGSSRAVFETQKAGGKDVGYRWTSGI